MDQTNMGILLPKSFVSVLSLILVGLFFGGHSSYAQGVGTISGTVIDQASGEKLPFANVQLEGTSLGTSTDEEGGFKIHQIPVGEYKIMVTYIGYREQTLSIVVTAGETQNVKIKLDYVQQKSLLACSNQ